MFKKNQPNEASIKADWPHGSKNVGITIAHLLGLAGHQIVHKTTKKRNKNEKKVL